eukprot:g9856.t1
MPTKPKVKPSIMKKDVDWTKELRRAVLKGKLNEATLAIERGASVNQEFKGKWTNVHFAVRQNKPQILKLLIQHGGNVNKKKSDGATPLHVACSAGFLEVTKILAENNADVLATNNRGDSGLHIAANFGHVDTIKYLVGRKCPMRLKNKHGSNPAHLAAANGHAAALLALMEASGSNNISKSTEFNSLIMDTTLKGNTPLHLAYFFDKRDVVKLLLGLGANACTLNKDGLKPFEVTRFRKRKVTSQIQFSPKKRCKKKGRNERFICTVKSTDTNTESTSWERYALYLNSILKAHNISVQTFEDFVFSSVPEQSSPGEKEETVTERSTSPFREILSPMNKDRSQKKWQYTNEFGTKEKVNVDCRIELGTEN